MTGGSWNFCRATTGSFEAAAFVSRSLKRRRSVSMKRFFLFAGVNCGSGKWSSLREESSWSRIMLFRSVRWEIWVFLRNTLSGHPPWPSHGLSHLWRLQSLQLLSIYLSRWSMICATALLRTKGQALCPAERRTQRVFILKIWCSRSKRHFIDSELFWQRKDWSANETTITTCYASCAPELSILRKRRPCLRLCWNGEKT